MYRNQVFLAFLIYSVLSSSILPFPQPSNPFTQQSTRLLADKNLSQDTEEMLHIEKLIDLAHDYILTASTDWKPFSDLKSIVDLSFSQYVGITIRIAISVSVQSRMKLRVMIDGVQNKFFQREVGQTNYILIMAKQFIWLAKGKHTIEIQYMKTGADQKILNNRLNMALFKLQYLNRKQIVKQPNNIETKSITELLTKLDALESRISNLQQINLKLSNNQNKKKRVYYGQVKSQQWLSGILKQKKIFINYQHLGLKSNPLVFITVTGQSHHWRFNGVNSIYFLSNKSCVVYLQNQISNPTIDELVKKYRYSLHYQIVSQDE